MAKYRKINSQSDSLELLLDTMCNTFGGIMFIAIALLILSSFVSKTLKTETDVKDIEELKLKITQVQNKTNIINEKIQLKERLIKGLKNSPKKDLVEKIATLKNNNNKFQNDIKNLKREIFEKGKRIKQLTDKNKNKQNLITDSNLKISKLKKKLTLLKEEYNIAVSSKTKTEKRELVFKKFKTTKKIPYWCILKGERLYQIGPHLKPIGDDVTYTKLDDGGCLYKIVPSKGIKISLNKTDRLEPLRYSLDSKKHFLYCIVFPDSFKTMIIIKEYFNKYNFTYNWFSVTDEGDCILYPAKIDDIFKSQ